MYVVAIIFALIGMVAAVVHIFTDFFRSQNDMAWLLYSLSQILMWVSLFFLLNKADSLRREG